MIGSREFKLPESLLLKPPLRQAPKVMPAAHDLRDVCPAAAKKYLITDLFQPSSKANHRLHRFAQIIECIGNAESNHYLGFSPCDCKPRHPARATKKAIFFLIICAHQRNLRFQVFLLV